MLIGRLALASAGLLLASCSDTATWDVSGSRIEDGGLVWASGSAVHLGDGSTVDAGEPIRAYVVTGRGIYFVAEQDPELKRATPRGVDATGSRPDPDSLKVSPDGRHLAFIDLGPEPAEAVAVDLEHGREVVRSNAGMGSRDDDLPALYSELEPRILGFSGQRVVVMDVDHIRAYRLDSGDGQIVGDRDADVAVDQPDERAARTRKGWTIRDLDWDRPPQIVADDGTIVRPKLTEDDMKSSPFDPTVGRVRWSLNSWLDDDTAVGLAQVAHSLDGAERLVVITCKIPSGNCAAVPGTLDGVLIPIDRRGGPLVLAPIG